jgi:hypothetical protein
MLRSVAFLKNDVSEKRSASFIRVIICELVTASFVPSSPIPVTLMMQALCSLKRRFLQEPHCVTSQKTPFFNILRWLTSQMPKPVQECLDKSDVIGERRVWGRVLIVMKRAVHSLRGFSVHQNTRSNGLISSGLVKWLLLKRDTRQWKEERAGGERKRGQFIWQQLA